MIKFFTKAGVIAVTVACGIAIVGAGIAGITLAVKGAKNRAEQNTPIDSGAEGR